MTEPAKPCPFCGGADLRRVDLYTNDGDYDITECTACKACAPTDVWNTRTKHDAPTWQEQLVAADGDAEEEIHL